MTSDDRYQAALNRWGWSYAEAKGHAVDRTQDVCLDAYRGFGGSDVTPV